MDMKKSMALEKGREDSEKEYQKSGTRGEGIKQERDVTPPQIEMYGTFQNFPFLKYLFLFWG